MVGCAIGAANGVRMAPHRRLRMRADGRAQANGPNAVKAPRLAANYPLLHTATVLAGRAGRSPSPLQESAHGWIRTAAEG